MHHTARSSWLLLPLHSSATEQRHHPHGQKARIDDLEASKTIDEVCAVKLSDLNHQSQQTSYPKALDAHGQTYVFPVRLHQMPIAELR